MCAVTAKLRFRQQHPRERFRALAQEPECSILSDGGVAHAAILSGMGPAKKPGDINSDARPASGVRELRLDVWVGVKAGDQIANSHLELHKFEADEENLYRNQGDRAHLLGDDGGEERLKSGHGKARAGENLAEAEIRSLLWLKQPGNELLLEALEEWNAKDVLFASRVDKKKKQSNSLRNEVYQLIGFYSVFQGVLLTAASQSNLLTCHNWWTAFSLCLLASLVTLAGVVQKFWSVLELEKTISNEDNSRKDCIRRVYKLKQKRENFSFAKDAKDSTRKVPGQTRLKVSAVLVVLALVAFSVFFGTSIIQILCDSGVEQP